MCEQLKQQIEDASRSTPNNHINTQGYSDDSKYTDVKNIAGNKYMGSNPHESKYIAGHGDMQGNKLTGLRNKQVYCGMSTDQKYADMTNKYMGDLNQNNKYTHDQAKYMEQNDRGAMDANTKYVDPDNKYSHPNGAMIQASMDFNTLLNSNAQRHNGRNCDTSMPDELLEAKAKVLLYVYVYVFVCVLSVCVCMYV